MPLTSLRAPRALLPVLFGLLLLLGPASPVYAHAELIGADPADGAVLDRAPERVQLLYSEPIEPDFFSIQVFAPDRSRVDLGNTRVAPYDTRVLEVGLRDVGPGTYTIVWRALSLDSHVVRGTFAFSVGAGAEPGRPLVLEVPAEGAPFAWETLARWATFAAAFFLLGGFLGFPLVLLPSLRRAGAVERIAEASVERWVPLGWAAVVVLLAAAFASLLFQASAAAGIPVAEVLSGRAVTRLLTGTKFGVLWAARVALCILAAGALAWLVADPRAARRLAPWVVGIVASAGILLALAATGHASAVQTNAWLAVLMDWLHLAAGGAWIGGLVMLLVVLPPTLASLDPDGRRWLLGAAVPRFSVMAGVAVASIVASGVYAGFLYVPSPVALLDTAYGAALSGKLLLFLPLLLLGAVNLVVLHPRFRRAAEARTPTRAPRERNGTHRVFLGLVGAEVLLALGVLGATGILTGLPPAYTVPAEGKPFSESARAATGAAAVQLNVRPNQAGDNRIEVYVADASRRPVDAERVEVVLTMLDMAMGQREVTLQSTEEPGVYATQGNHLSMSGHWQAEVRVRRPGGQEDLTPFNLQVGAAPGAFRPPFSPGRILLLAVTDPSREGGFPINPRAILTLTALAGGVFLLVRLGDVRRRTDRRPIQAAASLMLALALVVGGTTVAEAYRLSLPNPVPADAGSLARGQQVYQSAGCASCHGDAGRGDGPEGRALRPRPADFRAHMAAGHTDRELFAWITDGVAGTAMPPFGGGLSEQERWDVINYIRTFAGQP